ncbi:MAG: hypothetical protein HY708_01290 [Ignavibacteriae bacterium]|nr:hypothetical protein [Ignavibacteriota bacterium]
MRRRFFLLLLIPTSLLAQDKVNVSVSNYLRYGTGVDGFLSQKRDYVENLTDSRIALYDFLVGFRLLHDAPPEYGLEFTGVQKRYLEFKKDDLYIRAGDSYSLFGRGLALNLFENRPLAYDTGVDGIKMEYKTRIMKFALTGGTIRYRDVVDLSRSERYDIRGGSLELAPYSSFSFGANFVSGKFRILDTFPDQHAQFDVPEFFGRVQVGEVDMFASYAEKRTTVFTPDPIFGARPTHRGSGFYASIGFTQESFGVTIDYKDYRFGIADPYDRVNPNRATKAYAFQNMPIVHKEHGFTLLSRYPHIIDFNDEVGYQIEINYTIFDHLTGIINASGASRHYTFSPTGDTNQIFQPTFASAPRKSSFLPDFSSKYSPFWEVYAEWQYFFEVDGTDYVLVGFNRRSDVTADEVLYTSSGPKIAATSSIGVPLALQYTLPAGWVVKFVAERQWMHEEKNPSQTKFFNQLLALSILRSPDYSVTLRYEFTSDKATVDGRKDWTALDIGFRLSKSHNITLTAGGDRGGQICANGVCRVVNPFLGFRASILSYL